ncbi:MAG: hypothetical protein JXJ22_14830 [Bacteroidales bacterium]|nr:hypothetical protein [Bacteroidales bacterium]
MESKPEQIRSLYDTVYNLYQLLGYTEADSINRVYNTITETTDTTSDQFLRHLEDNDKQQLERIQLDLYQYLIACNNFHEEIFVLEESLNKLEYDVKKQYISDSTFKRRLTEETRYLEDLSSRIYAKRNQVFLSMEQYYHMLSRQDSLPNLLSDDK